MTLESDQVDRESGQVDRVCRFPQCERPALASLPGVGRPPQYCQDPGHNRAAAWRARQRTKAEPATGPAAGQSARPVDAARARASEIRGQVTGLLEQLGAGRCRAARRTRPGRFRTLPAPTAIQHLLAHNPVS